MYQGNQRIMSVGRSVNRWRVHVDLGPGMSLNLIISANLIWVNQQNFEKCLIIHYVLPSIDIVYSDVNGDKTVEFLNG